MNKVAIQTLTYNNNGRIEALKYTFKTFSDNYQGDVIDWYIFLNGYNDDIFNVLSEMVFLYKDKFNIKITYSLENMGVGYGLNRLNELCEDYEYTFLLEDDWICLPYYMSGHTEDWFSKSIELLDSNKEIDQIHFRRYLDDLDDRQYGYAYWIKSDNIKSQIFNGNEYLVLNKREYTNNPSLRRMSSLFEKSIFPLYEAYDVNGKPLEIKGNDEWGIAEIRAMGNDTLVTAWLYLGNFVHYENWVYQDDFEQWKNAKFGCNVYEMNGWNSCKYGFLFPGHYFCGVCEKEQTMYKLDIHSSLYLERILPLEHSMVSNDIIIKEIKEVIKNPTIDAELYINSNLYLNSNYYRGEKQKK